MEQLKLKFCGIDQNWVVFWTILDQKSHFVLENDQFWSVIFGHFVNKIYPQSNLEHFLLKFFGFGRKMVVLKTIFDKNGKFALEFSFLNSYFWSNCELDIPWIEFGIFQIQILRFRSKIGRFWSDFRKKVKLALENFHFLTVIFGQIVN